MSRLPKLVIFGRQGAGKGTVGHRVAAHLGIHHISTGEILRREMAEALHSVSRCRPTSTMATSPRFGDVAA